MMRIFILKMIFISISWITVRDCLMFSWICQLLELFQCFFLGWYVLKLETHWMTSFCRLLFLCWLPYFILPIKGQFLWSIISMFCLLLVQDFSQPENLLLKTPKTFTWMKVLRHGWYVFFLVASLAPKHGIRQYW